MGLLNEINNVNRTLQDNQQKELTKAEQKEAEKLKKERIKHIFKNHLEYLFSFTKNVDDIEKLVSNLIKNKLQNIEFVNQNYFDKYNEYLKNSDIDYISEFYYKFIQEVQKEYLYIYRIEEHNRKEEERRKAIQEKAAQKEYIERQKQKQIAFNNAMQVIKLIMLLIASPFILIIFFVYGICKNTK